ncbi:hypothetical protein MKW98_016289 [Papaver atlanticum]|uniref:Uncharacterized protein n=1 Tax=Papaver atlanticum TaxID=357466 RepID=A0AAD4SJD1_9MAGN|nr:hypothetical protein MKW98_016289 [Papaver atlanticum]
MDLLGDSNVASAIAPSNVVIYECAGTLVSLSSAPTAIRAAANTCCQLLQSQSDNNVKLIVLDRLNELKTSHRDIMVDMIMDKEVVKTQSTELEKNGEYRQMLAQAIHFCAIKFPQVASTVVHLLTRVCSCALWIIGEYCFLLSEIESGLATIKQYGTDTSKPSQQVIPFTVSSRRFAILADGTYATQSAASETDISPPTLVQGSLSSPGNLRSLILTGNFFLEAVHLLMLLLIMVSMLQHGQSSFPPHPVDNDSYDIIIQKIWVQSCRDSFAQISHAQPDYLIDLYQLKSRKLSLPILLTLHASAKFQGMSQLELEDEVQDDLKRLNRILQLTKFSNPVYAEAYATVHLHDVVLGNLFLELATMGDLKLVEWPQNYTLAPESRKQIRANFKVSTTVTGVIYGNIVYETSNLTEQTVVVLNNIHIDITDYISPATSADNNMGIDSSCNTALRKPLNWVK